MEKDLKEILFDELQKRGVSVYRFARLTEIPESRIKGWKNGKGSPKLNDAQKIMKWLSGDITPNLGQLSTLSEPQNDYISPSRYITKLERMNEVLQESIQLSLNSILSGQGDLREALAKLAGRLDQRFDDVSEGLHNVSEAFQKSQGTDSKSSKGR